MIAQSSIQYSLVWRARIAQSLHLHMTRVLAVLYIFLQSRRGAQTLTFSYTPWKKHVVKWSLGGFWRMPSFLQNARWFRLWSVTFVWATMLKHVFKAPLSLPFIQERTYYLVTLKMPPVGEELYQKEHYGDWWPFNQPQSIWKASRYFLYFKHIEVPKRCINLKWRGKIVVLFY